MVKFWNWVSNASGERTLYLDGVIAEETWWGDEVTPKQFKAELDSGAGDITVWINSPGGDVFAAAQIYNMLMEYKGNVTVKIDGLAASAASVIAMAGTKTLMSPVSMIMIHNPATIAIGDSTEMERAKALLDEVKESIINAYEIKTGMSRVKLAHLMDNETWMSANRAEELGFVDGILFTEDADAVNRQNVLKNRSFVYSPVAVTNSFMGKFPKINKPEPEPEKKTEIATLYKRLSLIQ